MATFISLINLTEKGAKDIKSSPDRAAKFKAVAQKAGVIVKEIYWTMGAYDVVMIMETPDERNIAPVLIGLEQMGNVRTQTLRGYDAAEMKDIISKLPK